MADVISFNRYTEKAKERQNDSATKYLTHLPVGIGLGHKRELIKRCVKE
jgi:hypothetical protein